MLLTTDINEDLKSLTNEFIAKADLKEQVNFHIGNALEIIPSLEDSIDLVFIDADKTNYSNCFDLVSPKLKKGGYIITDNVLWSGDVLKTERDEDAEALRAFSEKVQANPRVKNLLLLIRDGLMLIEKIQD
jgi:predicted O-methyltransferase YrrM